MKKLAATAFLTAFCVTGVVGPSLADKADDAIKARQAYFQVVKFNFGKMVAMAKGDIAYDAAAAESAAKNLQALTKLDVLPMFPAGSDNEAKKGKTRALAKIWTDLEGVGKINADWQKAADNLVTVAAAGKDQLGPAVGAVGKQCSACHKGYRADKF